MKIICYIANQFIRKKSILYVEAFVESIIADHKVVCGKINYYC